MVYDPSLPRASVGGAKLYFAIACPIHVGNLHTKFGWISSNGFGWDSITDAGPFAFSKNREDKIINFIAARAKK